MYNLFLASIFCYFIFKYNPYFLPIISNNDKLFVHVY